MNSLQKKSQLFKRVFASAALITGLISVLVPSAAQAQVSLPNGTVDAAAVDLRVKVLGGWIAIDRQWWEGQWHINERWAPIQLTGAATDSGGCLSYPEVSKQLRTYSGDGLAWSADKRFTIRASDYFTGSDCQANRIRQLRWQDRSGNWMEYERLDAQTLQFRLARYGDKNNISVSLIYNNAGQLSQVKDHNGTAVLQYLYNGSNQLSEIRDLPNAQDNSPSRSVKYTWGSNTVNGQPTPVITKVTDVLGYDTTYAISNGRIDSITDPEGRIQRYTYITDRVASYTDALGYKTSYSYDYDKLKKEFYASTTGPGTDAAPGPTIDTWFDVEGRQVRRDIAGQTTYRRAQQDSRVETRADGLGRTTTITKDEYGNIVQIVNPDGSQKSSKYSAVHGQVTEETDELGVKTQYDYDGKGNLTKKTEALSLPEQRITEYQYDSNGQVSKVTRKGRTETNGTVTPDVSVQLTADAYGNFIAIVDPENNTETYSYNRRGKTLTVTDALGKIWRNTYDVAGQLKTEADPLNHQTSYNYDKTGNLVAITDPRNKTYQYKYDGNDRQIEQNDPFGNSYKTQYSATGQVAKAMDASGKFMQMEYDGLQRPAKATDGKGQTYQFDYTAEDGLEHALRQASKVSYPTFIRQDKYDLRGRRTQSTLLDGTEGRVHGFTYDGVGKTKTVTDANGKTRYLDYDALNAVVQVKNPAGNVVRLVRDTRSNVIAIVDPLGKTTKMAYDKRNLLVNSTDPLGKVTSYSYDANSRLAEINQANGQKVAYSYDDAGRLVRQREYNAVPVLVKTTDYSYDDADNLLNWNDGTVSATRQYDDADRLLNETINYGSFSLSHAYTWHANNQMASYTGPDGVTISYTYDEQGQMQSMAIPGEGSLSVSEWKWTEPTKVLLPGGTQQQMSYDGYLAMTSLKVTNPGQAVLFELQNQFGKLSELKQSSQDGTTLTYINDDANRLTSVNGGMFSGRNETYEVDAVGNRTKHDRTGTDTWVYDDANQLSTRGPISYQYDDSGNLIRKTDTRLIEPARTTQYAYDAFNRLSQVKDGNDQLIANYSYDPFDRRLSKTLGAGAINLPVGTPTGTTWYLYSEWGLLAEADGSGTLRSLFGWHPNEENGTRPLYTRVPAIGGGMRYAYYHNDHLGTPQRASDTAGNLVWAADYDGFGKAVIKDTGVNGITNNLRYPGQYFDPETGLHYNDRRFYDPDTGRYISRDPIGFEGGINLYAYARHSPNNFTDPTGEILPLLGCLAANYARCLALCMGLETVGDLIGGCGVDWEGNLKDCAKDCAWDMLPIPNPCGKFGKALSALGGLLGGLMDSFPGETMVHVRPANASNSDAQRGLSTLKPISQLKAGDEVLALAEWKEAGKAQGVDQRLSYEKVEELKITSHRQRTLVDLTFDDGQKLTATDGHPFNTPEGWRDAILLKKGGKLLLKDSGEDGKLREVSISSVLHRTETLTTYNLEVANAHTFFVGKEGVLVHNGRCTPKMRKEWEKLHGKEWPKNPMTEKIRPGGNQDGHHINPVSKGGDKTDPNNIMPMTPSEHMAHHKEHGYK